MSNTSNHQDINSKHILVCIPAFNEEKSISEIVSKAKSYATHVIVYDDGSTDKTSELAINAGAVVIRGSKNKGYGKSIEYALSTCLNKKCRYHGYARFRWAA